VVQKWPFSGKTVVTVSSGGIWDLSFGAVGDAKDNIYPRKDRAENKIDGIVALIMALSRAFLPGNSVVLGSDYELMLL
jgi:hypothetical protein